MVALRLNNLAVLASEQTHYEQAEALYRRALAIDEKAFGPQHASVAAARMNLASLHYKQGRVDDARAEAALARAILDAECGGGGGDFCRQALEVYGDLAKRLESPAAGSPAAPAEAAVPAPAPAPVAVVAPLPPVAAGDGAVAATPAAPAPSAAPDRVYRAQVASRRDQQAAEAALEELRRSQASVSGLPGRIARADLGDKGVWFRVQLGAFASGAQAQALCEELSRGGHKGCFVIASRP
jgi:cell division septation protein DedD